MEKVYISDFFCTLPLDKLDERISITVRHRVAKNPGKNKVAGHKDDRGGDRGKKYGYIRSLRGAYNITPPDSAGCTTFCKTRPGHNPDFCPRFKSQKITEATLHKKKLCTGCLGPRAECPKDCRNKKHVNKSRKTVYKTCQNCKKNKGLRIHQQCLQGAQGKNTRAPFVLQPMLDNAVIEAPDGTQPKVRTL